jgi:putative membrane-bound dehydrogenase-like protein
MAMNRWTDGIQVAATAIIQPRKPAGSGIRLISTCLAAVLMLVASWHPARAQEDELAKELPRIKPMEPAAALASFRVHAGFHLEPLAVEPLVTNPVSACYDADGRLYVVEMRGYPFPERSPSGTVALLEDRDGDGRFDERAVFLDRLAWPTGIVPYDGGVFIVAAAEILYAKDTDSDGVADVKRVMFTGFGTENVQGLANGLLWGPDGWIYGVTSSNVGMIQNRTRPGAKPVSVRGRDFRFRADGSAFEAISGGGQFGHAFDDWGHRFTCNNSNHVRQIVLPAHYLERNPALIPPAVILDIAAEGPAAPVFRISPPEPWRVVRTRQRAADPVLSRSLPSTELFATGFFTSATGITIYRGSAYPAEYRGNVFVGDVGGNLVHRKRLTVSGAAFLASRADESVEFLASTDNWFRPVNFANTPDGTLLILDLYRETIEHPLSIPEPIKRHLDLTSGKDRGRLYELCYSGTRRNRTPKLSTAPASELVKHLADPDGWWRETAQRLLFERRDRTIIPALVAMVRERPSALGRLHALWTLELLGALQTDAIALALADQEPRVREQAIRLAETRLKHEPELLKMLRARCDDPDPMVRFQLAFSLGEANEDPRAIGALASIALRDVESAWTRTAVLSSVAGRPLALLDVLAGKADFFNAAAGQGWLDALAFLVGREGKPAEVQGLLVQLKEARASSAALMRAALALARGRRRSGGSRASLVEGKSSGVIAALSAEAAPLCAANGPLDERLAAIRFLGLFDAKAARNVYPTLLDARQPAAVQLAVLQAFAGMFDRDAARQIIAGWKSMSPAVRREAVEVLFGRAEGIEAVLSAIQSRALSPSEIDPARWQAVLTHANPALSSAAQKILAAETVLSRDRSQVVSAYRPALELVGHRERGGEIFAKTCATCHQAEGRGTDVGPNLSTVANRSPEDLLVHILDPNREVAANFVNYNVATEGGRVISGIIAEEFAAALVLKRAEGASDVIPREQIEAVASTGVSLMPEGLEKGLSAQDLADLIAFVRSIRPAAPSTVAPAGAK